MTLPSSEELSNEQPSNQEPASDPLTIDQPAIEQPAVHEPANEQLAKPKPAKNRGGRPPALDARKKFEVCTIIAMGCSRNRAAAFVGCDPQTIVLTARRESEFAVALRKADVEREVTLLAKVQAEAKRQGGWRAATWLLERFYPDRYGKRRGGMMSREQVATVLSQFADIVKRGIRNGDDRKKVAAELRLLTNALATQEAGEGAR